MRWYRFARTVRLPATAERVWPLLAQTELLNREMGLPLPRFTFSPRPEGGTSAEGEASLGPVTLRYEEHPFDWVRPHFYSVRRTFRNGPFRDVIGRVDFAEANGETAVTTHVAIEAGILSAGLVHAFAAKSIQAFVETCEGFRLHLLDESQPAYRAESKRPPSDAARLRQGVEAMEREGFGAEGAALARFIETAAAGETVLFRPTRFTKEFGRRRAIELCLVATRVGLLDMAWRVMCPYCRGNKEVLAGLAELKTPVHCAACAISFESGFDSNVEVLFTAAFAVRPVVRAAYCIGGPQLAPHVVAQVYLGPGETRTLDAPMPGRRYRFVSLQAPQSATMEADPGVRVELDATGLSVQAGPDWTFANLLSQWAVIRIEQMDSALDLVTAAEVTTLGRFRDQFSSEVLAPETELAVRQAALLFTDLRGSTQMYRERGDAPSYSEVRRHFELVREIVTARGGGIVKTIGDAVMAAFYDPAEAVSAALEIQRREASLTVRIGVHAGPAIVVNANDRLDYFGRTVNLASRLERHSQGGDVVIAESLLADPRVGEVVAGVQSEKFCAAVPGVEEAMRMVRLRG